MRSFAGQEVETSLLRADSLLLYPNLLVCERAHSLVEATLIGWIVSDESEVEMTSRNMRFITKVALTTALLLVTANFFAAAAPQSAPNIPVDGSLASNKTGRGRSVKGTVVMDIPSGYHVNSNRPLEKFLIPTQLQIEASKGVRVGPITYPRPILRSLKFSKSKVSVFEGRTTIRFNVTVPRSFAANSAELKGRLRFQSCNDDTCFPPQTREVKLWLNVE
jgi:thiol:disulfide interchange protein DsbD